MGIPKRNPMTSPTTSIVKTYPQRYNIVGGFPNPVTAYWRTKTYYRQHKPYNLNLPYSTWTCALLKWGVGYSTLNPVCNAGSSTTGDGAYNHVNGFPQNTSFTAANTLVADVTSKARERFISAMKGSAGLGVDLAEAKQSMGMIEKRALQIFDFARALHKGRIKHAAEILGVASHPSYHAIARDLSVRGQLRKARFKRDVRLKAKAQKAFLTENDKTYSDLFLEFHFGWSPLVSDVYDSIDVLQRDIPAGRIIGRAKGFSNFDLSTPGPLPARVNKHSVNVKVTVGATVSMSNPNLALANQLGLVNPASLVWETVPFSFVVDWFVNVGDFLASFTEFAGYNVSNAFTSTFTSDTSEHVQRDPTSKAWAWSAFYFSMGANRVLDLPGVALKVRTPWRVSPSRAATAIALLIQQGFGR